MNTILRQPQRMSELLHESAATEAEEATASSSCSAKL
jgi:hypothetical protein